MLIIDCVNYRLAHKYCRGGLSTLPTENLTSIGRFSEQVVDVEEK